METRAWSRRWVSGQPAEWQLLPPEILCRILHHMPDKDRCAARLACCQWDQVFRMPQLWRERRFHFTGANEDEGWRALRYMETLGTHLRHLEVEIGMPVVKNARIISVATETFLSAKPRGLRLQTFALTGLEFFQTPLYRIARHRMRMVRALCAMLRRQKWLEHVDLACFQMGREEGARVLKALTYHCRNPRQGGKSRHDAESSRLASLELRDFFAEDTSVVEMSSFQEDMGRFSALRHVGLNLTYLSDVLLAQLTQSAGKTLETLSLSVDGSCLLLVAHMSNNRQTVSTADWRRAVLQAPKLRVAVDMRGRFRFIDFQRVLIPGMPLGCLSITSLIASLFFGSDDMQEHIGRLMTYLADNFCSTLTSFHLSWCDPSATWQHEEALVHLVRCCTLLRWMSMTMALPLATLLEVMAATAKRYSPSAPLHVHVTGLNRVVGLGRQKLTLSSSTCVIHTKDAAHTPR